LGSVGDRRLRSSVQFSRKVARPTYQNPPSYGDTRCSTAKPRFRSYQSFYSQLFGGEFAGKEGVVVDVRFNAGGNLAEQLIADLSAKSIGTIVDRDGVAVSDVPGNRWTKPSVLLANAFSYSDGSIFPHLYKAAGIGPFVGEPVPGTGTSVGWIELLGKKLQ
jgi:C-terminal processing protease CtpA/Prc